LRVEDIYCCPVVELAAATDSADTRRRFTPTAEENTRILVSHLQVLVMMMK